MGRLLVVDYLPPRDPRPERVVFAFDGGLLDESTVEQMTFPDGEISSVSFYTPAEARTRMMTLLADRLDVAVQASDQGVTALCEQGRRIA